MRQTDGKPEPIKAGVKEGVMNAPHFPSVFTVCWMAHLDWASLAYQNQRIYRNLQNQLLCADRGSRNDVIAVNQADSPTLHGQ